MSHQQCCKFWQQYKCSVFDFLLFLFPWIFTALLMWGFIDVKCKHYFYSILFWLVEFVALEFKSEREDRSDGIDFTTSLFCLPPQPHCCQKLASKVNIEWKQEIFFDNLKIFQFLWKQTSCHVVLLIRRFKRMHYRSGGKQIIILWMLEA